MSLDQVKHFIEAKNYTQAITLLETIRKNFENSPLYHLYYGAALAALGHDALAIASFEKCIQLDPTLLAPYKNLALICHRDGHHKADKYLTLANWIDPQDENIYSIIKTKYPKLILYPKSEIVFYTGTPFLENKFSPLSLSEKAVGGSETAFVMMAHELARLGHKVSCFCNTPNAGVFDGVAYYPVQQFFLYAKEHKIPNLICSRFIYPLEKGFSGEKNYVWLHELVMFASADDISAVDPLVTKYICLSDYHVKMIKNRYQLADQKFIKTRNGFIEADFRFSNKRQNKSIIYFSRPERGLKMVLEMFEKIKSLWPDAVLHVCHYTQASALTEDESLKPFLKSLSKEGIVFHGGLNKKELAELLSRTEIGLYPNILDVETSCIAAIECMAAGCVMISSDRGALPETIANRETGIIVEYGEGDVFLEQRLFEAVKNCFENADELERLSKKAIEYAQKIHPWSKIAAEWGDIIEKK
ncbi:MAG: glycosyl transferase group 1 [uncultured bacterium]|nr:MAG: glycosyl transferase group 1 [uncultured bacterium]